MFLSDLTWLQMRQHVLLVSIPIMETMAATTAAGAGAGVGADTQTLWSLLQGVAEFWRQKGVVFLVFVLQGKSALQIELPRM